jgi:hypothetical protein
MATILQRRLLGEVRGNTHDGVSQFLGIQYATLKDRFADAELIEQREGSILDASKDGYEWPEKYITRQRTNSGISLAQLLCLLRSGVTSSLATFNISFQRKSFLNRT